MNYSGYFTDKEGNIYNISSERKIYKWIGTAGWYRIARYDFSDGTAFSGTLNIETRYNYSHDMTTMLAVGFTSSNAKIVNLCAILDGIPIPKVRVIQEGNYYYLEIYYQLNVSNYTRIRTSESMLLELINFEKTEESSGIVKDILTLNNS